METTNFANGPIKGKNIRTPATLNNTCMTDTRTASRGLPIEAKNAVTQVPILAPNDKAIPAGSVIKPCIAITMITPVVAELD